MQPITFCKRCRGMKVGWNSRYMVHCLVCRGWVSKSVKLFVVTVTMSAIIFAFPVATGIGMAEPGQPSGAGVAVVHTTRTPVKKTVSTRSMAVTNVENMLAKHGVKGGLRERVAKAIVNSSQKYNVDSRLVTSILLVESRANPLAISEADSIGIMQIHLPTWGSLAEKQGINLFKIEDNVDLGTRILKGYTSRYGLWGGVAHYTGWSDDPEIQQIAMNYVRKVQKIYGFIPDSKSSRIPPTAVQD